MTLLYFAYGSNMLSRRLRSADRAPSAVAIGAGYVQVRRLTFDKVSSDGSGKCDIEVTGNESDRVYGVLFEIAAAEKPNLDRAEGLGNGYREERVQVVTAEGNREAIAYVATVKEPLLQPYHWYKALVVAGAIEHSLPSGYVEWLRTFDSKPDPDTERRGENEGLLFSDQEAGASNHMGKSAYVRKFAGRYTEDGKKAKALEFALDIRKFEIDLYWKRAAYFWAFLALALGGYFTVLGSKDIADVDKSEPLLLIACLGFVFSVAWYLVNRGSKFWQTNWEKHVDLLEDETLGPLYKTILGERSDRLANLFGAYPFSVSKINQILSLFITSVFVLLLVTTIYRYFHVAWPPEPYPTTMAILTILAILFLWVKGRTGTGDSHVLARVRKTEIKEWISRS